MILPYLKTCPVIQLTKDEIKEIDDFIGELYNAKKKELLYKKDGGAMLKRFKTGFMGEYAISKFLGEKIHDFTVGNSSLYDVSDLSSIGLNIGVKSVEVYKFPIIHKNPVRPEIITVVNKDSGGIAICGLASIECMKKYSSDELILSADLRKRNVKTGFYGFEHLIKINNKKDLE